MSLLYIMTCEAKYLVHHEAACSESENLDLMFWIGNAVCVGRCVVLNEWFKYNPPVSDLGKQSVLNEQHRY